MTPSEPQTDSNENESGNPTTLQPSRTRPWLLPLFALLAVLGTSVAVWRFLIPTQRTSQTTTTTTQSQTPAVPVKLSTIQSGTIQESSDFVASLQSRRSETLSSKIQGKITQIFIKPGQAIKEGAPILQIEPPPQPVALPAPTVNSAALTAQSQLDIARSTLASLEAERTGILAEVNSNQQVFDRYNTLASEGAVPRQTKDIYANRLNAAKTNLKVIQSRIQTQQAAVAQAQKVIQQAQTPAVKPTPQPTPTNYRITAPFTGVVREIPIKVGDLVNPSAQLLTITQDQPLEVHIIVPVERAAKVKNGTQVNILNLQGNTIGTSRVFFVAPNPGNAQSALIKALYNNSKNELKADQFVRARIIWNQRQGALVPGTAVSRVSGGTFVYVAEALPDKSGKYIARQRQVKLGNATGNNYQVLEGLQPNDKVITSGLLNLRDGDTIIPQS
ncbi:MAG: efflux RND transporter periplasmic adaptor subunit [Calothrix sp. FI2-JRJ7]|jgi:multidrug efflux pump subunit AcrA (membrane-fusion protein)|nr:efflux RND transporter periplasmic adaptor subunit [Calothrix sp. FI2-JRJ7]